MPKFTEGQLVRISPDAWPSSDNAFDIAARGQLAELVQVFEGGDDPLWWAILEENYDLVTPLESELEPVEEEHDHANA